MKRYCCFGDSEGASSPVQLLRVANSVAATATVLSASGRTAPASAAATLVVSAAVQAIPVPPSAQHVFVALVVTLSLLLLKSLHLLAQSTPDSGCCRPHSHSRNGITRHTRHIAPSDYYRHDDKTRNLPPHQPFQEDSPAAATLPLDIPD